MRKKARQKAAADNRKGRCETANDKKTTTSVSNMLANFVGRNDNDAGEKSKGNTTAMARSRSASWIFGCNDATGEKMGIDGCTWMLVCSTIERKLSPNFSQSSMVTRA